MKRFKFLWSLFFLLILFLFIIRFSAYPISSFLLKKINISYDFSNIDFDFDGVLSLKDFTFSFGQSIEFAADSLSVSVGRKFINLETKEGEKRNFKMRNLAKNEWVVRHFKVANSALKLGEGLFSGGGDFELPDAIFPFLIETIDIDKLQLSITVDKNNEISLSDVSLKGDRFYELNLPANSIKTDLLKVEENLNFAAALKFGAKENFYSIESFSLDFDGDFFSVNADKSNDFKKLSGKIEADLTKIGRLFGLNSKEENQTLRGKVFLDFTAEESLPKYLKRLTASDFYQNLGKRGAQNEKSGDKRVNLDILKALPKSDLVFSVSDLFYNGFRPWDVHAYLKIGPTKMFIERFNMFHNDKISVSLDGIFPYDEREISGVVRLYDFDFDDCLRRMTTDGIVEMIVSGKVDYRLPIDALVAEMRADLVVTHFDVANGKILNLPRDVYVTGDLSIGKKKKELGVYLHNAIVKTKDETSRLIVKDSFYGFADTMKFHIPILSGSYINLEDVDTISGFKVKGDGAIDVLITSHYKNPRIFGSFSGTSCHFAGFDAENCALDVSLKNLLLDFKIKEVRQNTISSRDSRVAINFNKRGTPVTFLINEAEGKLSDAAAVFGINLQSLSGVVKLRAEGEFKDGLSKLSGNLKIKNLYKRGVDGKKSFKIVDLINLKLVDKDGSNLSGSGLISYGRNSIKLDAQIAKKDLNSDISAYFDSFYLEDFKFMTDVSFKKPIFDMKLSGLLSSPDIKASLKIPKIEVHGVKMGDLLAEANYFGDSVDLKVKGKLGESVKFDAFVSKFKKENFRANLNIKNFVHKTSDFFIKFSLDGNINEEKIESWVKALKVQKGSIFVQNVKPFKISGNFEDLKIEKTYFEGETTNFFIDGSIKNFVPNLKAKGVLFPRMLEMIKPDLLTGIDGRFYFDLSLVDRRLSGNLKISDFSYKLKEPQIVLSGFNGTLRLDGDRWKIDEFSGFAGGGKAILKGEGTLPFENVSLNLSLVNMTGKYSAIGNFALSAELDLIASGKEQLSLSGDIDLKNILYNQPLSLDSDFIKMISKLGKSKAGAELDDSTPIDLNLKIIGKNNIRVRTNLIETDLLLDLLVTGTNKNPNIVGALQMKNGKLVYKQNDFAVTRGNITFEEGGGIVPFLDLESTRDATTKIQNREKEFKITMSARGYPFDGELDVVFDSVPQLEEEQLRSLLLWGNVGDAFSPDLAIAFVTDMMGLTTGVRKNFNLSKFELVPKYSELNDKTVLKLIAEKEIYRNLYLMLESNPSDVRDQIIELKYKTKRFESILGWKNKDSLESSLGAFGLDLKLEFVFE